VEVDKSRRTAPAEYAQSEHPSRGGRDRCREEACARFSEQITIEQFDAMLDRASLRGRGRDRVGRETRKLLERNG